MKILIPNSMKFKKRNVYEKKKIKEFNFLDSNPSMFILFIKKNFPLRTLITKKKIQKIQKKGRKMKKKIT